MVDTSFIVARRVAPEGRWIITFIITMFMIIMFMIIIFVCFLIIEDACGESPPRHRAHGGLRIED